MKLDGTYEKPKFRLWSQSPSTTMYIWFQINGPDIVWRRKKEFWDV